MKASWGKLLADLYWAEVGIAPQGSQYTAACSSPHGAAPRRWKGPQCEAAFWLAQKTGARLRAHKAPDSSSLKNQWLSLFNFWIGETPTWFKAECIKRAIKSVFIKEPLICGGQQGAELCSSVTRVFQERPLWEASVSHIIFHLYCFVLTENNTCSL